MLLPETLFYLYSFLLYVIQFLLATIATRRKEEQRNGKEYRNIKLDSDVNEEEELYLDEMEEFEEEFNDAAFEDFDEDELITAIEIGDE